MRCRGTIESGLMVVGIAIIYGFSSVSHANTSAQEVLEESPVEVLTVSEAAPTAPSVVADEESVEDALEGEVEKVEVKTPVNDYGDELLNQLYAD